MTRFHCSRTSPGHPSQAHFARYLSGRNTRIAPIALVCASLGFVSHRAVAASDPLPQTTNNASAVENGALPAVSVSAAPVPATAADTGTTRAGHIKTDTADLGPLGKMKRLDTPYTINVVPQAVIESQQLRSVVDALRYLPSVQGDGARPQSRGIQGSVVQNTRIDGMNAVSTTDYSAEEFDRIEVLNGLSGALYGPANPAGTFNFVQKRPTDSRLIRFSLGYGTHDRFTRAVDLSDRFGPTRAIGYRLTLLDETGTGYTANSSIRRQLVSTAFDFHLSPDTVVQTNFSHYHYVALGLPATFALTSGARFPSALDPTNAAYASRNGGNNDTTDTATLRILHTFSPNWHLTAGVLRQIADRESTTPTYSIYPNGTYRASISTATASQFTITSNAVHLNGTFDTGPVSHDVSIGTSGFIWDSYNPYDGGTAILGTGSLANPTSFGLSGLPNFTDRYQSASAWQQSLTLSDDVTFTPRWQVLLAGSQSWLASRNFGKNGAQTSRSDNAGQSGSASLIFKPRGDMTTYVTYADSLQQGDTAPAGATNAGAILAPYRSREWEAGYKIALQRMNVSLAAFRITRPFAYTNGSGVYAVAGEQRNNGVELMLDGNLTRDLSLFGGVTWLDPRLFDTGSASTDGKRIMGLPHFALNMLAAYRVPVLDGLSTSVNLHYISSRPTDDTDTTSVSGYATVDLSAAYRTKLFGKRTTFQIGIYNITNKQYWTNIYPSSLNGYTGAGYASAQLGAPRTVQMTVQFEL